MSLYSRNMIAVPFGIIGVLTGAACTADWLSDPNVAGMFWPADINAKIVRFLGGEPASPLRATQVSALSVALRFLGLTAFALAVGRLFNRQLTAELLMRVGIIGLVSGVIWGIQPLAPHGFSLAIPPLVMLLAGTALYSLLMPCFGPGRTSAVSGLKPAWTLMLVVTVAWICISFRLNERLYANLLIPHGDSAMYEEHLWNVWQGKGFRSYLDQGLFLGEHIQVIHLLLLPAHMIWPTHLTLELAESVALGSCTIPLFLIVYRHTHDAWTACLLAISWLFFFPMHFLDIAVDQKTFRPVCLGLPFLFWMIQSAESGRFSRAWVLLLLALSAKEDMALITAPLGAVMAVSAWRGNTAQQSLRNWSIAMASVSAAWLLLAVLIVIPMFRSGDVVHYSRYFGELGSSPYELFCTAVSRPAVFLTEIFSSRTLFYVVVLLAPVAFLPLLSPLPLAAGSFTFLMLSLIQLGNSTGSGGFPPVPYHHFHAPLLPVLFWAAARGISGIGRLHVRVPYLLPATSRSTALLVLCCCVATGTVGSLLPYGSNYWSDSSSFGRHMLYFPRENVTAENHLIRRAAMADRVMAQIPATARVASTDFIHTRLTHCERSYDYSDYKRAVNEIGKRVPADCDYIVIDTGHRYSSIRNATEVPELSESKNWELLPDTTDGRFLILHRSLSVRSSGNPISGNSE